MKKTVTATLTASLLLLLSACSAEHTPAKESDNPTWAIECSPDSNDIADDLRGVTLPCLGTDIDHTVGSINGKPLLITLWASWCRPCVTEAPILQEFHEIAGNRVDVLGVNTQDTKTAARYFAEDMSWTFPSVYDERGTVLKTQGVVTLPATFLIAPDGTTIETFTEETLDLDDLTSAVNTHFPDTP